MVSLVTFSSCSSSWIRSANQAASNSSSLAFSCCASLGIHSQRVFRSPRSVSTSDLINYI
jgi:hypothetical protein